MIKTRKVNGKRTVLVGASPRVSAMYTTLSRVSKCVRLNGKQSSTYVQILSPELPHDIRARLGQVFGVIRAETDGKTGDSLVAHLEDGFVRACNEAMTRAAGLPREAMIEHILMKLNAVMDTVFGEYGLPVDRSSVHSALLFLNGNSLAASFWGTAHAYLLRLSDSPKLFDISTARQNSHDVSYGQYAEVISGSVSAKDRILLATNDLFSAVDRDTVLKTLAANRSDAAAVALGGLFAAANPTPIAIIVAGEPTYGQPQATSHTSVEGLMNTASKTRDILSPPLFKPITSKLSGGVTKAFGHIGRTATSLFGATQHALRTDRSPSPESLYPTEETVFEDGVNVLEERAPETQTNEIVYSAEPRQAPLIQDAASALTGGLHTLARSSTSLFQALRTPDQRTATIHSIRTFFPNLTTSLVDMFNVLPRGKKVAVSSVMAGIMVFNGGMMGILAKQNAEKKVAAYENAVLVIQQKIDAAESSLIYNDYSRAKTLLDEAVLLAAALPNKSSEEQENRAKLEASINEERQTMRRESSLPAPTVIASLPESAPGTYTNLTFDGGSLLATTSAGELYSTSLKDNTSKRLGEAFGTTPLFVLAIPNAILFGGSDGKVRFINNAGATTASVPLEGLADLTITDAAFYGTALYVLDAPHNRVVKFPIATKSFGKAQLSLKDGTDISNGTGIAVDGSIYVLSANGAVTKLNRGLREQFGLQEVDPTPTASGKMDVAGNNDFLSFIDGERLLTYSKNTGRFLGQYTSPSLKTATDTVYDEKTRMLYVATGREIVAFHIQ